jgi:hypothetical protein
MGFGVGEVNAVSSCLIAQLTSILINSHVASVGREEMFTHINLEVL